MHSWGHRAIPAPASDALSRLETSWTGGRDAWFTGGSASAESPQKCSLSAAGCAGRDAAAWAAGEGSSAPQLREVTVCCCRTAPAGPSGTGTGL